MPGSLGVKVALILLPNAVLIHFWHCFVPFSLFSPWHGPEDWKKKKQDKSTCFPTPGDVKRL